MLKRLLVFAILSWGLFSWWTERPVRHGPGVVAPGKPHQVKIKSGAAAPFSFEGYTLTPLANFRLKARVLAKARYRFDRESDLCPYDLALGWEQMSDESVLDRLKIWQSHRFYYWSARTLPVPKKEIERSSANMHPIPSSREVSTAIRRVRKGHVIEMAGALVRVDAPDGWHWVSSLQRSDSGYGACELIWVEQMRILEPAGSKNGD